MRRNLWGLLVILLLVSAGTTWADGPVSISRIGDLYSGTFDVPAIPVSDCIVGGYEYTNLQLVEHTFLGMYGVWFNGDDACGYSGFRIWNVHFLIAIQEPVAFDISVAWYTSMYNHGNPFAPILGLIQESETLSVSFPELGIYEVSFPFAGDECAYPGYGYMFSVSFPEMLTSVFGVCSLNIYWEYYCANYFGVGGECSYPGGPCYLMEDYGWPGNMVMWADAECCFPPVNTEQENWGEVKALYR